MKSDLIFRRGMLMVFLLTYVAFLYGQQGLFPNMRGEVLASAVRDQYKPDRVLTYKDARNVMYTEIYNEQGYVYCVYSEYSLPCAKDEENPIAKLGKLNMLKSIITEHSYPRSKGARDGNAKSDMHHLFPARLGVNVARRNYPFGEIADRQTEKWYYKKEGLRTKPTRNIDRYCESKNGLFEPPEHFKGNIARAIFYFYTMYTEEALAEDPDFFESQRKTLLQWHKQDPVDPVEVRRTHQIADYQSGLPNPFIIDPSLADRIYGQR